MVGVMLALTPRQQKWVWVLTDFRVRKPSASNIAEFHEQDMADSDNIPDSCNL